MPGTGYTRTRADSNLTPKQQRSGRRWLIAGGGLMVAAVLMVAGAWIGHATAGHRTVVVSVPAKPTRGGVPAHSRAGAANAAYEIEAQLGSDHFLDPSWRTSVLQRIAAPEARGRLVKQWTDGMRLVEASTKLVTSVRLHHAVLGFTKSIAYKVVDYSDEQAKVQVWSVSVLGGVDGFAPTTGWQTTTYVMEWHDGKWLLADSQIKDGPTPVGSPDHPTAATQLIAQYDGMTRYQR